MVDDNTGINNTVANRVSIGCRENIATYFLPKYTEVGFVSFPSGEYTTMIVIKPLEKKLEKSISVQYSGHRKYSFVAYSRVRNKHSPTIIDFLFFFQGLRPYSGLHSIR